MKPGFPAEILLCNWGAQLCEVFGTYSVYCVGSCAKGKKNWRDVDVVVMLEDEAFDSWFGPLGDKTRAPRWEAICLAFSLWGQKVTGLPIDFKVQKTSAANEKHQGPRCYIGPIIYAESKPQNRGGQANSEAQHPIRPKGRTAMSEKTRANSTICSDPVI